MLGLSHPTPSNLGLNVDVLLIELLLLNQQLLYAPQRHLLRIFEVLNPTLRYRYVDVHFSALLIQLVHDRRLLLDQVLVLEDPPLLVEQDVVLLDDPVLLLDLVRELVMLRLSCLALLIFFVEHLVTRDLTVHVSVVALHVGQLLVQDEAL